MKRSTENWITGTLAVIFLIYVAVRAWLLPITHDEGATLLNHVPRLVFDTLTFQKEANPNNHILNTLAIKTLLGLFPAHQFVVRLPVLIGCGLYLWAGIAISRRLSEQVWVRLFCLVMLLGNPFLAEFFGLARGYGLAIGLMMMALYQALRFFEENTARLLRNAIIFAGLAVYANFTQVLFFAPFTLLVSGIAWRQNRSWASFWSVARPALYTFGVFILLLAIPLSRMSKDRELVNWNRLSSNFETVELLIHDSIRGKAYLGDNTVTILSWSALIGICIGVCMAIAQFRRHGWRMMSDPKVFLAIILAGTLITNLVNVNVFHTAQLNARLSLLFYPLFALLVASEADWLWQRWGRRSWVLMAPLLALVLINNIRCMNLTDCREWWYDRSTLEVLDKIKAIYIAEGRTEPYTFDCGWGFQNSFMVHIQEFPQGYDQVVRFTGWHENRAPVPGPDFFYVIEQGEIKTLQENNYYIVCKVPIAYILRKK